MKLMKVETPQHDEKQQQMSRFNAYIFDYIYVLPIFRPAMQDFFRAVVG